MNYGNGGPNGTRIYWPAGLSEMRPEERAAALARGYWFDQGAVVTRDGLRFEVGTPEHADALARLDALRSGT